MNKDYGIIMGYFNRKNFDRERLEKSCDFDNLTMTKDITKDITKLLADEGYKNLNHRVLLDSLLGL